MASCMAGTTATGLPLPRAVVAKVVTGRIINAAGHLADGVGSGGSDESRSALPSTPQNSTFPPAGYLRDHMIGAGILQCIRMQDLLRALGS